MIPRKPDAKPMNRRGKKSRKWDTVRAELKKEFEAMGVVTCEICGVDNYLSFAHRLKRRYVTTADELRYVALLCIQDHERIEHSGGQAMYDRITEIVEKRKARLSS